MPSLWSGISNQIDWLHSRLGRTLQLALFWGMVTYVGFHQKPSIDCLELDVSKKFLSLANLLIKILHSYGTSIFPPFFKGFCSWESFSPSQREEGLSLVQHKEILPRSELLVCVGLATFGSCLVDWLFQRRSQFIAWSADLSVVCWGSCTSDVSSPLGGGFGMDVEAHRHIIGFAWG